MKALRTYQRAVEDAKAALPNLKGLDGYAEVSLVTGLLEDLAETLPAIERREKARRERIQWVYCGARAFVARFKGRAYRYSGEHHRVDKDTSGGWVEIGKATSIEGASRLLRRLRKAGKL